MNSRYYKSQFTIKPLFIFRNSQKRSVCLVFVCFIFSSNRNLTLNELERNLTRDVIIMNSKYYMNHNLQNNLSYLESLKEVKVCLVFGFSFFFFSSNRNLNLN